MTTLRLSEANKQFDYAVCNTEAFDPNGEKYDFFRKHPALLLDALKKEGFNLPGPPPKREIITHMGYDYVIITVYL